MSDPVDIRRNLDHCQQSIEDAAEAMAHDMYDAATRLGAAAMMLASASHAVHRHAERLTQAQAQAQTEPDAGPGPASEGP
jgi:hypothetical protein